MKTELMTAIIATAFLSSMLSMTVVTPAIAENPVITVVKRSAGSCWFLLTTGYYPNGVWVRDTYYVERGFLGLTYRNLSPEQQLIRLTISPGANHAFFHWPEDTAWPIADDVAYIEWPVGTDDVLLMIDLWFVGWNSGEQICVKLELISPKQMLLFEGYMTIMPLG